ncbi:MAG: hypothetical protein JW795_22845, partial [Chitinivibrionales bacterium]|nr:hypothetical protein [Chitinivibrionales bacterium]
KETQKTVQISSKSPKSLPDTPPVRNNHEVEVQPRPISLAEATITETDLEMEPQEARTRFEPQHHFDTIDVGSTIAEDIENINIIKNIEEKSLREEKKEPVTASTGKPVLPPPSAKPKNLNTQLPVLPEFELPVRSGPEENVKKLSPFDTDGSMQDVARTQIFDMKSLAELSLKSIHTTHDQIEEIEVSLPAPGTQTDINDGKRERGTKKVRKREIVPLEISVATKSYKHIIVLTMIGIITLLAALSALLFLFFQDYFFPL